MQQYCLSSPLFSQIYNPRVVQALLLRALELAAAAHVGVNEADKRDRHERKSTHTHTHTLDVLQEKKSLRKGKNILLPRSDGFFVVVAAALPAL